MTEVFADYGYGVQIERLSRNHEVEQVIYSSLGSPKNMWVSDVPPWGPPPGGPGSQRRTVGHL